MMKTKLIFVLAAISLPFCTAAPVDCEGRDQGWFDDDMQSYIGITPGGSFSTLVKGVFGWSDEDPFNKACRQSCESKCKPTNFMNPCLSACFMYVKSHQGMSEKELIKDINDKKYKSLAMFPKILEIDLGNSAREALTNLEVFVIEKVKGIIKPLIIHALDFVAKHGGKARDYLRLQNPSDDVIKEKMENLKKMVGNDKLFNAKELETIAVNAKIIAQELGKIDPNDPNYANLDDTVLTNAITAIQNTEITQHVQETFKDINGDLQELFKQSIAELIMLWIEDLAVPFGSLVTDAPMTPVIMAITFALEDKVRQVSTDIVNTMTNAFVPATGILAKIKDKNTRKDLLISINKTSENMRSHYKDLKNRFIGYISGLYKMVITDSQSK